MIDDNEALWERHARWWQRNFSEGADAEYVEQILPLVGRHLGRARRVLDIGCGEGQVARHLVGLGVEVIGLDPTPSQIGAAQARGGGPAYARARADALPCRSETFDGVLVCLALEHVDAFEATIGEVARTLARHGHFLLVLCHPLLQAPESGWIDDRVGDERYWRIGSYLRDDTAVDEVEPGVTLRFIHRPLSRYVHAIGQAGLVIEDMEEPIPPPRLLAEMWNYPEADTIPRVLVIRARHREMNAMKHALPVAPLVRRSAT
jgi:SAM-dependent methyltransferase